MGSKTDIPGMDRPIEKYVGRCRRRQAIERERNRRLAHRARCDSEHIAVMLRETFGATRVILFGSLATERFSARSDIDLAVEGLAPADYFPALAEAGKLTDFPLI
ncbi:nucleotidyltransferase family protein [Roseiflexus sp.]|uniref:nucleotidyltransferase family protein n=1 Tax=Roseiflexus sp. TaxID=2562120 RepID=UPI00398B0495